MQYAITFPGQGSQALGMLSDLAANFSAVKDVFTEASDVLGFDLWQLTQNNEQALNQTINTQPAMLAAGYATYSVLNSELDLSPICMAGHSLGEYTALVAAGAINFSDAINLVRQRADFMQSALPAEAASMAAILGLDDDLIIKLCSEYAGGGIVEPVNFNSPGQVVIAGDKAAVADVCDTLKKAGARRALVLPVSIASHCSLMNGAASEFATVINAANFNMPNVGVVHNFDARKAIDINDMKLKLIAQINNPVLWTASVGYIQSLGVDCLIEAGPGKVLTGLNRRIDKSLDAFCAFDAASVAQIVNNIAN